MSSWYFSVNRVCQGLCQDGFAAVPYSLYPIPDPAINLNTNPGTYFESRPGSKEKLTILFSQNKICNTIYFCL